MKNKSTYFHFQKAKDLMWNYCIPLGKFTYKGKKYDLGLHVYEGEISGAIVHGNEPGDYYSPTLSTLKNPPKEYSMSPIYKETWRRYNELLSKVEFVSFSGSGTSTCLENEKILISKLNMLNLKFNKNVNHKMGFTEIRYAPIVGLSILDCKIIEAETIIYRFQDLLGSYGSYRINMD